MRAPRAGIALSGEHATAVSIALVAALSERESMPLGQAWMRHVGQDLQAAADEIINGHLDDLRRHAGASRHASSPKRPHHAPPPCAVNNAVSGTTLRQMRSIQKLPPPNACPSACAIASRTSSGNRQKAYVQPNTTRKCELCIRSARRRYCSFQLRLSLITQS